MRYALPLDSAYNNPTRNRRRNTAVFFYPKPKNTKSKNNFYSRKAAESEENICHFLLRQLVYFKPL